MTSAVTYSEWGAALRNRLWSPKVSPDIELVPSKQQNRVSLMSMFRTFKPVVILSNERSDLVYETLTKDRYFSMNSFSISSKQLKNKPVISFQAALVASSE